MSFQNRKITTNSSVGMSQIELEQLYAKSQTYHAISGAFIASGAKNSLKPWGKM